MTKKIPFHEPAFSNSKEIVICENFTFDTNDMDKFLSWISNNKEITQLTLTKFELDSKKLSDLLKSLSNHLNLHTLILYENKIDDIGIIQLFTAIESNQFPNLRNISVGYNCFSSKSIQNIARCLENNKKIMKLSLSGNKICDKDIFILKNALISNTHLTHLGLAYCEITDVGAKTIISLLEINKTLVKLSLNGNKITDETFQKFHKLDRLNPTNGNIDSTGIIERTISENREESDIASSEYSTSSMISQKSEESSWSNSESSSEEKGNDVSSTASLEKLRLSFIESTPKELENFLNQKKREIQKQLKLKDTKGRNFLHLCVLPYDKTKFITPEILELFFDKYEKHTIQLINSADNCGNSPLHSSIIFNNALAFEKLLVTIKRLATKKPSLLEIIETSNNDHKTPLFLGVERGHYRIIQTLIKLHPTIDLQVYHGESIIDYANYPISSQIQVVKISSDKSEEKLKSWKESHSVGSILFLGSDETWKAYLIKNQIKEIEDKALESDSELVFELKNSNPNISKISDILKKRSLFDIKPQINQNAIKSSLTLLKLRKNCYLVAHSFRQKCKLTKVSQISQHHVGKGKIKDRVSESVGNFLPKQKEFVKLVEQHELYLPTSIIDAIATSFAQKIKDQKINASLEVFFTTITPSLTETLREVIAGTQPPSPLSIPPQLKPIDDEPIANITEQVTEFYEALQHFFFFKVHMYHALDLQLVSKPNSTSLELLDAVKNYLPTIIGVGSTLLTHFIPSGTLATLINKGEDIASSALPIIFNKLEIFFQRRQSSQLKEEIKSIKALFWDSRKNRTNNFSISSICNLMQKRYDEQINKLHLDDVSKLADCICNRIVNHILAAKNVYINEPQNGVIRNLNNFLHWIKRNYSTIYTQPDKLPLDQRSILALYYEQDGRADSSTVTTIDSKEIYIYGCIELSGIKVWDETTKQYSYYGSSNIKTDAYGFCEGTEEEALGLRGLTLVNNPSRPISTAITYKQSALIAANSTIYSSIDNTPSNNNANKVIARHSKLLTIQ